MTWYPLWHNPSEQQASCPASGCHKEEKCTIPLQSRKAPVSLPMAAAAALIPTTIPHQANHTCYFGMFFQLPPICFLSPYQDLTLIPHPHCFPTHTYTKKQSLEKKGNRRAASGPATFSEIICQPWKVRNWAWSSGRETREMCRSLMNTPLPPQARWEIWNSFGQFLHHRQACPPWGQESCLCPPAQRQALPTG